MNYKVGDTLGGYTLLAECGKGAYGSVFLAENTLTKQQVALKIVYHAGETSLCYEALSSRREVPAPFF